jgi:hypothetical protein
MRALLRLAVLPLLAVLLATGCSSKKPRVTAPGNPRTYGMGFSAIPPRANDLPLVIATIDLWAQRADHALLLTEPPWDSLLAGVPADTLVRGFQLGLANYYRAKGLRIVASVDPTNGLDRSADSAPLVAAGRSLTEPAVRALYRDWCVALDTLIRPDYLGIASETNLVRLAAPAALYDAVVLAAESTAIAVRAADARVKLFSTVQVETAWGRFAPPYAYLGIAQDRADFPFMQALGLSSYPYLGGFADPDSLPNDYYSRLTAGSPIPMMVIEGGWASTTVALPSTPEIQRRYIARHARLLDAVQAVAWFQITFTDLDLGSLPPTLGPFAWNGLVDVNLQPKPALGSWDAEFARPKR